LHFLVGYSKIETVQNFGLNLQASLNIIDFHVLIFLLPIYYHLILFLSFKSIFIIHFQIFLFILTGLIIFKFAIEAPIINFVN